MFARFCELGVWWLSAPGCVGSQDGAATDRTRSDRAFKDRESRREAMLKFKTLLTAFVCAVPNVTGP
ncbi:MAG TPA: hypothetical protein P5057_03965 [Acidobacteriota bacterium]|nr:hypothetical protein [Acidobacteriota bacterium]